MSSVSKFLSYFVSGKFGKIGSAVNERISCTVYHKGTASIFELSRADYVRAALRAEFPNGYQCRLTMLDEIPACTSLFDFSEEKYRRRFNAGDDCYGVFKDGRLVNFNWIHRGRCYVRGMGYLHEGGEKEYYIYGIMTIPSERGKGLYKNCLIEIADYLFRHGAERLIQMVEDGNASVFQTLPKLGYKKTMTIRNLTIMGIRRTVAVDSMGQEKTRKLFIAIPEDIYII